GVSFSLMVNLNPLKYCFRCQRSKPRGTFRTFPGDTSKRKLCAECYDMMAATEQKMRKAQDSEDIQRAVHDGMQDLRTKKN
ncbi:MAG: hypothetical protein ACREVG_08730, partial [Burkholderiales bacterium]